MTSCDQCGKQTTIAATTLPEYGSMELCDACYSELNRVIVEAMRPAMEQVRVAKIEAWKAWSGRSGELPEPIKPKVASWAPAVIAVAVLGLAVVGAWRVWDEWRWRYPAPGEVRTWFDPTNDPPRGGIRHVVNAIGDPFSIVHTPGMGGCEYCASDSRSRP